MNNDFSSFYSAALAYLDHANPYQHLSTAFLIKPSPLAVTVNPPFFILLFSPLTAFDYPTASLLWAISSLILGVVGWLLCFYLSTNHSFFKQNWFNLILIYLASYACLINTSFNQVAGFLLFLIMLGYYFLIKQRDYTCGIVWGLAAALKLFPGLFFIFVLVEKRYKIFWTMSTVFILAWFLPLFTRGSEIYLQFFANLSEIIWYGNTWNASLLAYLFRVFVDMNHPTNVLMIKIIYQLLFIMILVYYIKKLNQLKNKIHYGFSLSLIIMLLLSPFGWMYYFALLLPALILIYQTFAQEETQRRITIWSICLCLINLPIENIQARFIPSLFSKLSLSSIYFYGLLMVLALFFYVIKFNPQPLQFKAKSNTGYLRPIEFILCFSVLVVFATLTKHFQQ
ncbi:glycosyltransferase family 87 protein [Legionella sp. km772]|uniref:glycosyltransferase family 87 protein n=1 Tax=Legionella sp. km772 TaxID=2498111 RepID=UPI0013156D3C|nr:glycosyltransferase family 87 protein [Legionella sp. km772]